MKPDGRAILNAFPEPILIVLTDGRVSYGNKAARAVLGEIAGRSLLELSTESDDRLRNCLRQFSGSKEPTIGIISLLDECGEARAFRCHGSLVRPPMEGEPAQILIRLLGEPQERFSQLSKQIDDLNSEVRRRRRIQLLLEEALRDRELLLRELSHRVKNNIQMLLSMLSSAKTAAHQPETKMVLERAYSRVAAIGAAQKLFYRSGVGSISTTDFINEVCNAVMQAVGPEHELTLDIPAAELSSDLAAPIALILNELITNSVKHGFAKTERGRIAVALRVNGDKFELTVADDGAGFEPSTMRVNGSGMGLVHGLARTMGGSVEISGKSGTRCIIQFVDSKDRTRGASHAGE